VRTSALPDALADAFRLLRAVPRDRATRGERRPLDDDEEVHPRSRGLPPLLRLQSTHAPHHRAVALARAAAQAAAV